MRTLTVVSWHHAKKITAWTVRGSFPMLSLLQMALTGAGIRSKNDGCSLTGIKRPGRSVNHFPSSSVEVKRGWSYTSAAPICLHDTDWVNFTHYLPSVSQTFLLSFLYEQNVKFAYLEYEEPRCGQASSCIHTSGVPTWEF